MTSDHHAPLRPGLHVCYNGRSTGCDAATWTDPLKPVQFGSQSATRLREGGVASNRESKQRRGECVQGLHRPSSHKSGHPEAGGLTQWDGAV